MDRWGIAGCESRFDRIVDHLVDQAKKDRVAKHLGAFSRIAASAGLRKAIDNAKRKTQFKSKYSAVWVYWAGGAAGDELRYSMRSAQTNLTDMQNIVLCGDIPDWFQGDAIVSRKWTKSQNKRRFGTKRWAKWVDSIIKLKRIIDDDRVTDDFLWMYDDTFIMRPMRIGNLLEPRASGRIRTTESGHVWRTARARTAKALSDAGLPNWDYSTHCPIVFNKQKLRETIAKFRPDKNPRVIESLYGNQWHSNPRGCRNFFHYRKKPSETWKPPKWAKIVNVGGFNHRVRQVIIPRFNQPSEVEIGSGLRDAA